MIFFQRRRDNVLLQQFLERVAGLTDINGNVDAITVRRDHRMPRSFPVFLVPVEQEEFLWDRAMYGFCQDISERGMGIVVGRHFEGEQVVIGLWPVNEMVTAASTQPGFIRGEVRNQAEIGAGFYRLGVQGQGLIGESHPQYQALFQRAKSLLPPEQLRLWKLAHQPN
jgi:hypothetical protein